MSKSALCEAIENKDLDKVRLLIEEKADIDETDSLDPPIFLACRLGNNTAPSLLEDYQLLLKVVRKSFLFWLKAAVT